MAVKSQIMMAFILNLFLFLLGLGIGVKYERWVRDKANAGGHSRFQETGFQDSRYQKSGSFKSSTNARPASGSSKKGNSRFHIS